MSTDNSLSEAFQTLSTKEAATRSAALKADGNRLFGEKKYEDAIRVYSQAISIDKSNAILYCNRSAAYFGVHACVLDAGSQLLVLTADVSLALVDAVRMQRRCSG